MDLKASAQRVQEILQQHQLDVKVVEFSASTRTCEDAARTIGCEVGQIAKSMIFRGKQSLKPICVVASGKNQVDEQKVALYMGEEVERPNAKYVLQHTSFAIGGIPPIGYTFESQTLIDADLMLYAELWAAAGTPYAVFRMTPPDLVRLTQGRVVDVRK